MTIQIGLLRAVNVGGTGKIAMADLRAFFGALGFKNAQTLLQSGNVVFDGGRKTGAALEVLLERQAAARLSLRTEFFLRTPEEWEAVIAANPFPRAAREDPSHLLVMFLRAAPDLTALDEFRAASKGREAFAAHGRQLFIAFPDGIGTSKLNLASLEKAIGTRGTSRNWNTIRKLDALAKE